jgi:PleD family two-component response regulator
MPAAAIAATRVNRSCLSTASGRSSSSCAGVRDDGSLNILLVDDQPSNLLALESILVPREPRDGRVGRCRAAASAAHGLRGGAARRADADLDGFETANLIRQRERSRRYPIIFLTALSRSETNVFRGYELGAVDHIFKPFHPEILARR